ncbi:hypothetical protein CHS0354_004875 [Potamilus streckersoni]|uniref:Uncharacterized protein n=1 Tax=Potamilus streckersoni TaxID=2493646 RepID=A0AAE0SIP8_9BIVA|nr:hypothetical protein CHS0354_004875 [Potamilus streckersoni]
MMSVDVLQIPQSLGLKLGQYGQAIRSSTISSSHSRDKRPQSTPLPGSRPVSYPGGSETGLSGKISRPKTAATVLGMTHIVECDRVSQLEHEPTRRHNFETHVAAKKTKPPPWQKNLDQVSPSRKKERIQSPLVPFVVGPGYILSRSKSKFAVTLKDEFFDPVPEEDTKKKQVESERDSLNRQLQQQIDNMTLYLEEERLNHRMTKQKAEEFLKDKVEELTNNHREHIRQLEEQHRDELDQLQTRLETEHNQYKSMTETQASRMKKEIEFLQGAFESYKSSLHQEMDDKWKKRQGDLTQELEAQKNQAIQEMRTKLLQERTTEKVQNSKEHQRVIDSLRKEHKRELDGLTRRFSNVAADLERLKKTTIELQETKQELNLLKQRYDETCQQMVNTTRELTDTKVRLLSFEEQFDTKVQEVDEKYKKRIEELMTQNTELKRLYVQKCGELFEEKILFEKDRVQRVNTSKEAIMHSLLRSKQKADISFKPGDEKLDEKGTKPKERPGSAPITKMEYNEAQTTAGETDHLLPQEEDMIRPNVLLPEDSEEIKELRRKLMEDTKLISKEDLLKLNI